jgi:hypothetical protein
LPRIEGLFDQLNGVVLYEFHLYSGHNNIRTRVHVIEKKSFLH